MPASRQRKQERKLLEFSDFEHQALRLLRTPDGVCTPLCQSIRQNYAAVMVDEYQDTNALQDAIYRCLASPAGDDLFLVGDLKQSIYRFRQADPSIFRTKLDVWAPLPGGTARPRPAEGTPGTDALLALDANFRSAPQVVAGINFIFEQLMTPQLGDTAYGDGQRLVCGAPGDYAGSVEAHFLPDDTAETDAAWIAQRVEELVKNGEPVRDGSSTRPVQYEDCCILLAARGDFLAYEEALTGPGHPGVCGCARKPDGGSAHPAADLAFEGHRQPGAGYLPCRRHAGADVRLYGRRPCTPACPERRNAEKGAGGTRREGNGQKGFPHESVRRSAAGGAEW